MLLKVSNVHVRRMSLVIMSVLHYEDMNPFYRTRLTQSVHLFLIKDLQMRSLISMAECNKDIVNKSRR